MTKLEKNIAILRNCEIHLEKKWSEGMYLMRVRTIIRINELNQEMFKTK